MAPFGDFDYPGIPEYLLPQPSTVACSKCGSYVSQSRERCPGCGKQLRPPSPTSPPTP